MSCQSCGMNLEASARFCGGCGARIESPTAPPPAAPPAAEPRGRADPLIGRVLSDRFRIDSKLGEGGFGAVYKGTQTRTGRQVAIKLLHPEMTRDSNLVARFRREGEVLCRLRDAHTVTTYDFDQTSDGMLYIAMELLEGPTLHDVFHREAPIAWRRVVKILAELCSSLAEAHELGIVHRDLKPENIHLESRPGNAELVKVLDFGIAKVMRGDGNNKTVQQLTATGQTLGTLEYMSPEQLMGRQLDGRSDIYAIGVLAYEMLTGQLPFPDATGPATLISAQLKSTPRAPSQARPDADIPADIDALVLRMLAKEPVSRFEHVQALRAACETLLDGSISSQMPIPTGQPPAHAASAPARLGPPRTDPSPGAPASAPGPDGVTSTSRTKLWPWLVLAGILAAAAIASAVVLSG